MMITKKEFEEFIFNYKVQMKIDQTFSDAIDLISGSQSCCFNSENLVYLSMFNMLKIIFNDENDWIQWWIYDKELGDRKDLNAYDIDKNIIKLDTANDLYYFLIQNMNEKEVIEKKSKKTKMNKTEDLMDYIGKLRKPKNEK